MIADEQKIKSGTAIILDPSDQVILFGCYLFFLFFWLTIFVTKSLKLQYTYTTYTAVKSF